MKSAPRQHCRDVAFEQPVFFLCKESGHSQCGERQYVVTAHLEEGQHIRLLDKLQDPVCKPHKNPRARAVPVGHENDKKHTAQRHAPAPGHVPDLNIRCDKGQRHRRRAEYELLCAHPFLCGMFPREIRRRQKQYDPGNNGKRIPGVCKAALCIDKYSRHNKSPPVFRLKTKGL